MTQEVLKLALETLEDACGECCNAEYNPCFQRKAITAIKKALAQQEPQIAINSEIVGYVTPQRTWVGLMRGVRVEGDSLVITVKGGNEAARELCGQLINEMGTLGNQK